MKLALTVSMGLAMIASTAACAQSAARSGDSATEIDGNWYVGSDSGQLILVARQGYCSELTGTVDNQTLFCRVSVPWNGPTPAPTVELDVFRRNGVKLAIKPGGAIGEWRIQGDGAQVAIDIYERDKILRHDLYDATTGDLVASVKQPADPSTLPQWAKTISQLQDESVPESASLSEERTKWIAKVMNELAEIRPGMTRKDISKVLTEEGGLSTRAHRTYVYVGCPYIKVDIEFNPVGDLDEVGDRPDDVVKTVSRPYLEYSIAD